MRLLAILISILFIIGCSQKKNNPSPDSEIEKKLNSATDTNVESKNDITVSLEYDTPALLGEGAIWNHQSNTLWWVDIEANELHIFSPNNKSNKTIDVAERIGTVVPDNQGNAIVALQSGVYRLDIDSKEKSLIATPHTDTDSIRLNDGKCDPSGRLWVGSMHLSQHKGMADLYSIEKGKTTKQLPGVTISNGICWSADHSTMYYIDTPSGEIKIYDYDHKNGKLLDLKRTIPVPESLGFPDGMTIDENDNLWVGLWNGNAIAHYNSKSGELIKTYPIPSHNVTSCAFGGEHLDILYITTASIDMTEGEKKKYPKAGSVFSLIPGVKGVKASFYKN